MDIALLGTGGGMPMPDRFLASLLIRYKGRKILVDCGEGSQVSMRILKWGFKTLDMILLTHGHGDHVFGLPGLLSTLANSGRTQDIIIIGPRGINQIASRLVSAIGYLPYEVHIYEAAQTSLAIKLSGLGVEIGKPAKLKGDFDLLISTLELDHSVPCLGYSFSIPRKPKFNLERAQALGIPKELWKLLQGGGVISHKGKIIRPNQVLGESRKGIKVSYITDTRPTNSIGKFIKESDLFICEGTYGSDKYKEKAILNKHMTFSEAGQLAKDGRVKELVLTHFSAAMEEPDLYLEAAKNIFPNSKIGFDGYIKTLTFGP